MTSPGRNDPCPCGSGRKYKHCCGAATNPLEVAAALHDLDNSLVERILRWGGRSFPEDFRTAIDECPCDPEAEERAQILGPYLAYHAPVRGRPLVDHFLERQGARLDARERAWLEANQRSWISIWEVIDVFPDRGLQLRDLLSSEERGVAERLGTRGLRPRMALCARVVEADGVHLMVGSHPRPLGPLEADQVVAEVRRELGLPPGPVPVARLRGEAAATILRIWEAVVDATDRRPLPRLQNTDGDPLQQTVDRYAVADGARGEIERSLGRLAGFEVVDLPAEESPGATTFRVVRPGRSKGGLENVSLGTVEIDRSELRVRTNSERRADDLRSKVEAAGGRHLHHRERERRDPQDFLASALGRKLPAARGDAGIPVEVADQFVREFKERRYSTWPDEPLPALDGRTPREASGHPELRRRLVALLKEFEMGEAALPPGQRFDVEILRRELGVRVDE